MTTISKPGLIVPTVHMNGTSRQALIDQHLDAINALEAAMSKFSALSPNGRDYYPQGNRVIYDAIAAHNDRMSRIKQVRDELYAIVEVIHG